jgi:hypothetical protein
VLTVACVLRSGGIYNAEWVAKLQRGIARHLHDTPYWFVCLTDSDERLPFRCERDQLTNGWRGWWSKIELFRYGLFVGPVLYFDLDSVVVGSLDAIAAYPHRFTMAHEFYRPTMLCSTAMAWHGDYSFIYEAFEAEPERHLNIYDHEMPRRSCRIGDQAFIEDQLKAAGDPVATFRDLFGEHSIASYKVHECQSAPPPDAAVVAFHGSPKPHEITTGWVPQTWI